MTPKIHRPAFLFLALSLGLSLVTVVVATRRNQRPPSPARTSPAAPATTTPGASSTANGVVALAPEEIFRRAFWRQPTPADRIVHAERREWTSGRNATVQRWQWFLEVRPGPELLRTLRDPATFGLRPVTTLRASAAEAPGPAWFPAAPVSPNDPFELLQHPSASFTLLYRSRDNTLFASDTGSGFTPAVNPIESK